MWILLTKDKLDALGGLAVSDHEQRELRQERQAVVVDRGEFQN